MHRTDSADFIETVKRLLELMTREAREESNSDDGEYFISSDESDTDTDDNEHYSEDEQNNTVFRLNKSYADHADDTPRRLPPSTRNIEFREKIYRVIPLKLDERILKAVLSNDEVISDHLRSNR